MSAQDDTNCHDIFNIVSATRTHLAKIGAKCHVMPTCCDMSETFPAKISNRFTYVLLIILMCHTTPIVNWGLNVDSSPFLSIWRWNIPPKSGVGMSDWVILEQVLVRWRRLVASLKAMDLLHRGILTVSYQCIAMAIEAASKVSVFCIVVVLSLKFAPPLIQRKNGQTTKLCGTE
jgi:hypothetical protein